MNTSVFQQREESGSRKISSSLQCTRLISHRAAIGADEKLILQGLEVERIFFSHKLTMLNMCLGFLSTQVQFSWIVSIVLHMDALMIYASSIPLNCFHSAIKRCIDNFREKQGKPWKSIMLEGHENWKCVQAVDFGQRWLLCFRDTQVRSMVIQSLLGHQSRARDTFRIFGPFWSKALSEEALLLPLTTEVVKDEHTHKLGS